MKTGHIIGGVLIATGIGAGIYYGFIKKFSDGLTGFEKMRGKKSETNTAAIPTANKTASTTSKTKNLGNQIMDAVNNPNADLGLIANQVKSFGDLLDRSTNLSADAKPASKSSSKPVPKHYCQTHKCPGVNTSGQLY
jgi:hypothetical protein